MRRRTLDALLTTGGLIVATVLLVAGGLLTWASNFVADNVHTQLVAQRIDFPKAGSDQLNDPKVKPYLEQYAGQQLTTGAQAKAYADHFIKVHLEEATGGKTYSELSAAARANPGDAKAAALVDLAFKGETLRGLLLSAWGWSLVATIATAAGIVLILLGAILLLLPLAHWQVNLRGRHPRPAGA